MNNLTVGIFLSWMQCVFSSFIDDENRLKIAKILIKNGCSISKVLHSAIEYDRHNVAVYFINQILRKEGLGLQSAFYVAKYAIRSANLELFKNILEKSPKIISMIKHFPNLPKPILHWASHYRRLFDTPEQSTARYEIEKLLLKKGQELGKDLSQERDNRGHRPSYDSLRGEKRDLLRLCNIREKYKNGGRGAIRFNFFGNRNLRVTLRYSDKEKYSAADHLIKQVLSDDEPAQGDEITSEDENVLKYSPELKTINRHLTRG